MPHKSSESLFLPDPQRKTQRTLFSQSEKKITGLSLKGQTSTEIYTNWEHDR